MGIPISDEVAHLQVAHGLPAEGLLERRLQFCARLQVCVLSFAVEWRGIALSQVHVRKLSEPRYRRAIPPAGEGYSCSTPLLLPDGVLFSLVSQYVAVPNSPVGLGGNCLGIARVDLATGSCEVWTPDIGERVFISELTGVEREPDLGETLLAVAGIVDATTGDVTYQMVRLPWRSKVFEKLAVMVGVFF